MKHSMNFEILIRARAKLHLALGCIKNAAMRSRQHARIHRRLSSNERTHTRVNEPTVLPIKRRHRGGHAPTPLGQTDRGYKKPLTNTDNEIAIPSGIERIPDT